MANCRHSITIFFVSIFFLLVAPTHAQETPDIPPPETVTIAGTLQSQLGCSGDWQPLCQNTFLSYDAEQDLWIGAWELDAGNYEYKAALNGSWDDNFGLNGEYYGANIPLEVAEPMLVTFTYDHNTGIVTDSVSPQTAGDTASQAVSQPDFVTIPGTIQSVLGCSGDWQPDCSATFLTFDEEGEVWHGIFELPAGIYEYKVAIDQSWGENYGGRADRDGPNVVLELPAEQPVTFIYDHATNWVADSVNSIIATVVGDFQMAIGCGENHDPTCLRSWLQDPEGDGIYVVGTPKVPAGNYSAQIALNQAGLIGEPQTFTVPEGGNEIFFQYDSGTGEFNVSTDGAPKGNLGEAKAHWVAREIIAWSPQAEDASHFALFYRANGGLKIDRDGLGGNEVELTLDEMGLPATVTDKFPHLTNMNALIIGEADLRQVRIALKGQVAVAAFNGDGKLVDATSLQIPGVLDDVYPYDGELGVSFADGVPTLTLWAPTARAVTLHLFDSSQATLPEKIALRPNPNDGTWQVTGKADWLGKFYLYEVEVYAASEGRVVTNLVTDPYSVSLSTNSARSQIVDLSDSALIPDGWEMLDKPALAHPTDMVLYELHVRDFSAIDQSVPAELRGSYLAFTVSKSAGMSHLRGLAEAGLTHIHLLPTFDIATINENKAEWVNGDLASLATIAPDSEAQQATLNPNRDLDGFNWGYDPFHYNVPEGSYSTNPDGTSRILEYRQMVQALNEAGLRLVVDVVYNHTNASGQSEKSVLDKVVPGYYHRLTDTGRVATSTCCANTATEHDMMRKLMVDSVILWATQYKVDGFRFDLMGHHMTADMQAVREALDSLTLENDGVDGKSIVLYGEGWDFGEVAGGVRGENGTQLNVAGMGIGTFNDRIRDAARGGNPFGGLQEQGFVTGLWSYPNEVDSRPADGQLADLLHKSDQIRVGLAGNLANYQFVNSAGETVTGAEVDYNGSPAGYTQSPQEVINYVSAHDNETLFDAVQFKAPLSATMTERVAMQNMGISVVMMGQGIPFFHAGSEILRSKSFDRDSYNSGDWFNALDWTYSDNNWGHGLPPADKNQDNWQIMQPLLANRSLAPDQVNMMENLNHFQRMLQIRQSSPLFRLQTAEQVQEKLSFLNSGSEQIPGVIVMLLDDTVGENLDESYARIVVFFNGTNETVRFELPASIGVLGLHPVQALLSNSTLRGEAKDGVALLPPLTTTVLVELEMATELDEVVSVEEAGNDGTNAGNLRAIFAGGVLALLAVWAGIVWRQSNRHLS